MSPTPAVRSARTLIARSDRLFFDSRNLRYVTGLAKPEELDAATVKQLLEEGDLKVISANPQGIISMELTEAAFKRGVANRYRSKGTARRVDMAQLLGANTSGTRSPDDILDGARLRTVLAIPFTGALLTRLLTATEKALEAYRADPRLVGGVASTPGHLIPVKATQLRDNVLDILSFFEEADVNVMINAANAQYSFGTMVHGYWLGTDVHSIGGFISDTLERFGKRASNNLLRTAEKLLKDPLVAERTVHPDEGSSEIMKAIGKAQDAYEKRGAA